ncbi:Sec23/Sec24 zinc finger-containing protein [Vagococcus fluvialis]|nr:Sec23/Sec24 zinc finger-containing protein [Vagococcus fluvialis]OTP33289.1 hypothetical protein A5798_000018 [Enterococcus sp. 6C8_DIV0013]
MGERFADIDWYCDNCNAYLNGQDSFDDNKYIWKCTNCGFKSSISKDNIRYDDTEEEYL